MQILLKLGAIPCAVGGGWVLFGVFSGRIATWKEIAHEPAQLAPCLFYAGFGLVGFVPGYFLFVSKTKKTSDLVGVAIAECLVLAPAIIAVSIKLSGH